MKEYTSPEHKAFADAIEKIFSDCADMYIATVQKNLDELQKNIHRICSQ